MRSVIAKFVKIPEVSKDFIGNRVNTLENIPRCGVAPKFPDLEVVAPGITSRAFSFGNKNVLFCRTHKICANLIQPTGIDFPPPPFPLHSKGEGERTVCTSILDIIWRNECLLHLIFRTKKAGNKDFSVSLSPNVRTLLPRVPLRV